MNSLRTTRLLFIGDLTGERALEYLETHLPRLRLELDATFVVVNAENLALTGERGLDCFGMSPALLARLFALDVDVVTGGNHSWDGAHVQQVHGDPRVLRPLNVSPDLAGRGAHIAERSGFRLGVTNLVSRSAFPHADLPLPSLERQLETWEGQVDAVLIDMHGAQVDEKLTLAYAVTGRVAAVLGTHTHVQTLDTRVLPGGTAYVTDVGMTGPAGGIQGIHPAALVAGLRSQAVPDEALSLALGETELGAVLVTLQGSRAVQIERVGARRMLP